MRSRQIMLGWAAGGLAAIVGFVTSSVPAQGAGATLIVRPAVDRPADAQTGVKIVPVRGFGYSNGGASHSQYGGWHGASHGGHGWYHSYGLGHYGGSYRPGGYGYSYPGYGYSYPGYSYSYPGQGYRGWGGYSPYSGGYGYRYGYPSYGYGSVYPGYPLSYGHTSGVGGW